METTPSGAETIFCQRKLLVSQQSLTFNYHNWLRSLSYDNDSTPIGICLWKLTDLHGDFSHICCAEVVSDRKRLCLAFITKKQINIWEQLHHGIFEELTNKWSAQVQHESFVVPMGEFGNFQHYIRAYCERKPLKTIIENWNKFMSLTYTIPTAM